MLKKLSDREEYENAKFSVPDELFRVSSYLLPIDLILKNVVIEQPEQETNLEKI